MPHTTRGKPTLSLYVCGVTPYDSGHMGHAFTFSMFDVLVRFVESGGVRVRYVQNITDIDDPLFERARRDGDDWRILAERETAVHLRDMTALGWRPPDLMPRVSEEIGRINPRPPVKPVTVGALAGLNSGGGAPRHAARPNGSPG